jgi:hypothetical protein
MMASPLFAIETLIAIFRDPCPHHIREFRTHFALIDEGSLYIKKAFIPVLRLVIDLGE